MIFSNFEDESILLALNNSEVIAFPTETVYGLGIDYDSEIAYKKLCDLKKRSFNKPISIMTTLEWLNKNFNSFEITNKIKAIIDTFLPGPLTLLLKCNSSMPYQTHLGTYVVGVRIPKNVLLYNFLNKVGHPLQVTSANISGCKDLLTSKDIYNTFNGNKNLSIIIEGSVTSGVPSTIVDCTKDDIDLIREGEIDFEKIKKIYKNA